MAAVLLDTLQCIVSFCDFYPADKEPITTPTYNKPHLLHKLKAKATATLTLLSHKWNHLIPTDYNPQRQFQSDILLPQTVAEVTAEHYASVTARACGCSACEIRSLSPPHPDLVRRQQVSKGLLRLRLEDREGINSPFSLGEVQQAISSTNPTASASLHPAPKSTPRWKGMDVALHKLYNLIHQEARIPAPLLQNFLSVLPKGKSHRVTLNNTRTIGISNPIAKPLERMLTTRVMWQAETKKTIDVNQTAGRAFHDPTDSVFRMVQLAREHTRRGWVVVVGDTDGHKAFDQADALSTPMDLLDIGVPPGVTMNLFSDLTSKAKSRTAYKGHTSMPKIIHGSLVQGRTTSPSGYMAGNNDSHLGPHPIATSLHVDDTKFMVAAPTLKEAASKAQESFLAYVDKGVRKGFLANPKKFAATVITGNLSMVKSCPDGPMISANKASSHRFAKIEIKSHHVELKDLVILAQEEGKSLGIVLDSKLYVFRPSRPTTGAQSHVPRPPHFLGENLRRPRGHPHLRCTGQIALSLRSPGVETQQSRSCARFHQSQRFRPPRDRTKHRSHRCSEQERLPQRQSQQCHSLPPRISSRFLRQTGCKSFRQDVCTAPTHRDQSSPEAMGSSSTPRPNHLRLPLAAPTFQQSSF